MAEPDVNHSEYQHSSHPLPHFPSLQTSKACQHCKGLQGLEVGGRSTVVGDRGGMWAWISWLTVQLFSHIYSTINLTNVYWALTTGQAQYEATEDTAGWKQKASHFPRSPHSTEKTNIHKLSIRWGQLCPMQNDNAEWVGQRAMGERKGHYLFF